MYDLAGLFDFARTFPEQTGMWDLTAAQRALLLGPDKETPKAKKKPRIMARDELLKLAEKGAKHGATAARR